MCMELRLNVSILVSKVTVAREEERVLTLSSSVMTKELLQLQLQLQF